MMGLRPSALLRLLLLLGAAGAAGCAFWPDHDNGGEAAVDVFLAQNRDFADYRSWPSVVVAEGPVVDGHPSGERRVFVSELPADDADEFAVGTVIVKEGAGLEESGGVGDELHARVKRGGGFNDDGAVGWEWFELGNSDVGTPLIKWRGEQPPDGESYGCVAGVCDVGLGQCNECHAAARNNDFVLSAPLTLGDLDRALLP